MHEGIDGQEWTKVLCNVGCRVRRDMVVCGDVLEGLSRLRWGSGRRAR